MNRTTILGIWICGRRGRHKLAQTLVQVFRNEWRERRHRQAQRVQCFEKRVQSRDGVFWAILALQAPAIESNVPICEFIDHREQARHDRVQSIVAELFSHTLNQALASGKNPAVHDVAGHFSMRIVDEVNASVLFK